jgi:hypothetical protein
VLHRQVTTRRIAAVALASLALAACGGKDGGGAIEDNLIRPGITAMEQASVLACNGDLATLQAAIEAYSLLEGSPPVDEAALVASQFMRSESELFDVVDGQIIAQSPDCAGSAPVIAPAVTAPSTDLGEIVTSTEAPLTPEELLATLTDEQVADVGGADCARELVSVFSAAEAYVTEVGSDPTSFDDLLASGHLAQPITLWLIVDDNLVAAPGSGCISPEQAYMAATCRSAAKTLAVAREAYLAQLPGAPEPTQQALLDAEFIRDLFVSVDLVDGVPTVVPGGDCVGVDLSSDG